MKMIYLDYNATTPLAPEVFQAMEPFLTRHFGNPSSLHRFGQEPSKVIKQARQYVAALLRASDKSEIFFTSGGTESNNTAIRSALALAEGKKEIITTRVEHSSVFKLCQALEKEGFKVHKIRVDTEGHLDWDQLMHTLSDQTALVTIMLANNETGVVFPVEKIGALVKEHGIFFHVDAVQAVGKMALNLKESFVDFLSLSAHKFYGPKGTGALYVKKGVPFQPLIWGGSQERGKRAGTENVAGIAGMGEAARLVGADLALESQRVGTLRDQFEKKLCKRIAGIRLHGDLSNRIPNTSNLAIDQADGEALLFALDQRGVCASSGSACMSGSREPSHVLKAMGFSDEEANCSLRFSLGRNTGESELDEAVSIIAEVVAALRSIRLEEQHTHPI